MNPFDAKKPFFHEQDFFETNDWCETFEEEDDDVKRRSRRPESSSRPSLPLSPDSSLQRQHEKLSNLRRQLEFQHDEQKRQLDAFQANIEKQLVEARRFQLVHSPAAAFSSTPNRRASTSPKIDVGRSGNTPAMIARAKAVLQEHGGLLATPTQDTATSPATLPSSGFQPRERVTLVEKHRKHIEDLKEYYESEIEDLNAALEKTRVEANEHGQEIVEKLRDELEGVKLSNELLHQKLTQVERSSSMYERAVEELKGNVSFLEQKLERVGDELSSSESAVRQLQRDVEQLEKDKRAKEDLIDRMKSDLTERQGAKRLQRLRWTERPDDVLAIIRDECKDFNEAVRLAETILCKKRDKENRDEDDDGLVSHQLTTLQSIRDDFSKAATALEQCLQPRGVHLRRNKQRNEDSSQSLGYQAKHVQRSDVGLNDVARRKWLQPSEDNVFYYTPEKKRESSSPVMKAHSEYFDVDRGTIDALAAVKSGDVVGMGAWEEKGIGVARNKTAARRSERSTQQQRIVKLEQRLADLNADKNQIEHLLSRFSSRGKPLRQAKEEKSSLEGHLERTFAEIGSTRMALRKLNALKIS
ncbi:M-phase phosphoprotein 9-like isoform X2 [Oscarella lobularis]|uniref:M-phase phosphoprotein 9-like isoform X2 n=1 Tax=Oscarella lobularis TaxID=121494 RepID=UPI003313F140